MKASVELAGPNFIDIRIPHPIGGPQSSLNDEWRLLMTLLVAAIIALETHYNLLTLQ